MKHPKADNFSEFDPGFIDTVLHLMITDQKFMKEYHDDLKPELFGDELRSKLAEYAIQFYNDTSCVAKNLYMEHVASSCRDERTTEARRKLLHEKARSIYLLSPGNTQYVVNKLQGFFQFSKIRLSRYLLDKAVDEGDLEEAKRIIMQTQQSISSNHNRPVDYFRTVSQRIARREAVEAQKDGVHFLIQTLEAKGVYAHRGEVTLVIAPSKRGKSAFLTYAGKCGCFLGQNGLHVSLENPQRMVEDRYDAAFSGIEVELLRSHAEHLEIKMDTISNLASGRLYILWRMARTYSPMDLKADIQQLRADGNRIDFVIIDYGELMKPVGKYSGESAMRAIRDDIFLHLRALATEMDFTCITAQQTPLKKRSKFRIGMEDGQESSMPAQHSSLIITLNQTADEQALGEMRLAVDGYWHGPSGAQIGDILLKQDLARMQFVLQELPLSSGISAQKAKP